ncbi:MAG TPA: response regulator [Anaeromyxobacteraceae bacterium]|nr:response regulator [Anaeromyxobacteraceae bacterium]
MSEAEEIRPQGVEKSESSEVTGVNRERRVDARARVLVIEDEHDLRGMIAQWLEARGYEAVEAADGNDAIELIQAGLEPDAIILDLAMPRVSGQAFLSWLRAEPRHMHRPVIVTSGEYDSLPTSDVQGVLAKPYRPDLLAQELQRVLE